MCSTVFVDPRLVGTRIDVSLDERGEIDMICQLLRSDLGRSV
jgi:hypothetical protein